MNCENTIVVYGPLSKQDQHGSCVMCCPLRNQGCVVVDGLFIWSRVQTLD